jgi:hypothetical protein
MRGSPSSSRFSAPMNLPSQLAFGGAVTGGQANTFEAETGISMQIQCIMGTACGELSAGQSEGGERASTLARWWTKDSPASSCAVLDLFTEILTQDATYFRRRTTIRSLSHLSGSLDHQQAMRISDTQIAELQQILKQQFGLDYSAEEAQDAGRAILRFVGLKLYQQLEKDRLQDARAELRRGK